MSDFAIVTPWLAVGNRESCNIAVCQPHTCIHINRYDMPGYDCQRHVHVADVFIDYKDGDEISEEIFTSLDKLAEEIKKEPRTVLVHCAAGACRSVHLAAYLLARVDNLSAIAAFYCVDNAIWEQQQKHTNICYAPKKQIVERIDRLQKEAAQ